MKPPYYAVIFTSEQSGDLNGYSEFATRMEELAKREEGVEEKLRAFASPKFR